MNIESFNIFFKELLHNQPNKVFGKGTAILVFLKFISDYLIYIGN